MPPPPPTAGVILAGGRATRMGGGDKCRIVVQGQPIIHRIIAAIGPQVTALALNANGDPARFADLDLPILPDPLTDPLSDQPGPLAGVLAGLDWAVALGSDWLLTVPGDTPFLPPDLVARLHALRGDRPQACAATGPTLHPVIALWPITCRTALRAALHAGLRRVRAFGDPAVVMWGADGGDPFVNLNTRSDCQQLM